MAVIHVKFLQWNIEFSEKYLLAENTAGEEDETNGNDKMHNKLNEKEQKLGINI